MGLFCGMLLGIGVSLFGGLVEGCVLGRKRSVCCVFGRYCLNCYLRKIPSSGLYVSGFGVMPDLLMGKRALCRPETAFEVYTREIHMKFFHRCCGGRVRLLILLAALASGSVIAQEDYSTVGISGLFASASQMLESGDYAGAIPALQEVLLRVEELTDPRSVETLQTCRYQLGLAMFQTGQIDGGMAVLETYLLNEPRKDEPMALRMVAQGYLNSNEWGKVIETVEQLLAQPALQSDDLMNANLLLGQALFQQEDWARSVKPLAYASDHAKDEHISRVTGIMVVRALVNAGDWQKVFSWIPRLYRTDAKYDITLNLTLMNAGKAQFEKAGTEEESEKITEAYLRSLLLYRMVLPREDLIEFSNGQLHVLTKKLSAATASGMTGAKVEKLEMEVADLEESVRILNDLPPYESEVAFRVGQIYADVSRYWEGYVIFDKLYHEDATSEIGEASLLQSVMILYNEGVEETARAEARVIQYLDEYPDGLYTRLLLSIMIRDNLSKKNYAKVAGLLGYLQGLSAPPNPEEKNLVADINYIGAFGFFQQYQYAEASEQFSVVYDQFRESPLAGNALYFRGLSFMMMGKYEEALSFFRDYQTNYSQGDYAPVSMFREAVCLYGLERPLEAENIFSKFINNYPDDMLVSEAYSMRGDIEAAKEASAEDPYTLDRALSDYRTAIDKATDALQSSYPAFQAAKVFKLEAKWQEIIDLMVYYMERWEEGANVAEAVYWIGFSQIEMGEVTEAVDAYLEAVEHYGNDPSNMGVDKIIMELVKISQYHLSEEDRGGVAIRLKLKQTTLIEEDMAVLHLRLQILQSLLQGEDIATVLGAELLELQLDLKITSPVSLSLMCDAAVDMGDGDQMERLSEYFIEKFEDSDLLWHAYRAKTGKLLNDEDLHGVLDSIEEAQGLFGAESYMGWAQLSKAETLFKMKEYAEAEKEYNMVMGVSEWRGPIFAEAMYGMGLCRMAQNDLEKAHAFFQRTYLLFKSYDNGNWAAKGYLAAASCSKKLGNDEGAISTLEEMLSDDYTKENPLTETARKLLRKWGVQ